MPAETLEAFLDHGVVRRTVDQGVDEARERFAQAAHLGHRHEGHHRRAAARGRGPVSRLVRRAPGERRTQACRAADRQGGEDECLATRCSRRISQRLQTFDEQRFGERLFAHDATLWKDDPEHRKIIGNALGWLSVADDMQARGGDLAGFAAQVAADGYSARGAARHGRLEPRPRGAARARSAWPTAFSTCASATRPTRPPCWPSRRRLDLEQTLFIVSSKSGGTTETASFHAYFHERLQELVGDDEAGRHFIAITDPDTSLHREALAQGFRAVFLNPPDIGGRYSALSYFGLVPAALTGLDVRRLLDRAAHVAAMCRDGLPARDNPAFKVGAALGELARAGRDKVTFFLSPSIASLGAWLEQLLAESTGKEGTGLVPVDGETPGSPAVYGDDRVFVYLNVDGRARRAHRRGAARRSQRPVSRP